MSYLKKWRLIGSIVIIILGFVLHYVFSWSGHSRILGFFVPVNESVWEHLKLGYWSVTIFSVFEYVPIRKKVNNYFISKAIGVIALNLIIIIIYYTYKFMFSKEMVLMDITSYVIGTIICQYITYDLFVLEPLSKKINKLGFLVFILLGTLFGIATFHPPHAEIFKDSNDGKFGIK